MIVLLEFESQKSSFGRFLMAYTTQIGSRFWDLALREHAKHRNGDGLFDESMSSLFRNVDTRHSVDQDIPLTERRGGTDGGMKSRLATLRARCVLVDTEEGVTNQLVNNSSLGELFASKPSPILTTKGSSGSGNNWAQGHCEYGPEYHDALEDKIRKALEACSSPQSFFLLHSLGGGTGSGLGTYILRMLQDLYPELYRFTVSVFPSDNDDVITSPYNCMLSMKELNDAADCVIPVENQALAGICHTVQQRCGTYRSRHGEGRMDSGASNGTPVPRSKRGDPHTAVTGTSDHSAGFDDMNNIAAHLISNLTSSMRFHGSMNIDLNELTTNLVPFPKLHYLTSSLSPLYCLLDRKDDYATLKIDQMFNDCLSPSHQLIRAEPHKSSYLAMGLLLRGRISVSDTMRNVERMKRKITMAYWNMDSFKTGICEQSPLLQPYSLLSVSNNCCIRSTLRKMHDNYSQLFNVKAHLHHFRKYMQDDGLFSEASESIQDLIQEYEDLETATLEPVEAEPLPRVNATDPFPPLDPPTVDRHTAVQSDWNTVGLLSRLRPFP
eukprot:gb/GECG01014214.1/.p1 GENE.gb/GECG01014214.1/~~gb/GECG01014214.1/.p1  ORF type:complete len:552 (+),score=56.85 gb/GECG01014214.1/:1-1656(+)